MSGITNNKIITYFYSLNNNYINHLSTKSGKQIVFVLFTDVSLDPLNSPPISLSQMVFYTFEPYFAFFNGSKIYVYGYSLSSAYYGVTRMMFTTTYSSSQCNFVRMNSIHQNGMYAWIGNRVWVVGGYNPPGN
jgi:hypothetical protein